MSETDKISPEACLIMTELIRSEISTIDESILWDEAHIGEMQFLEKYIDEKRQTVMQLHRTLDELSVFGCHV